MFLKLISVFIGGGIGAIFRYIASLFAKKYFLTPIVGTFFVNIVGCFLIGYVCGLTLQKIDLLPQTLKIFITVGILGGLTTFSTLNLEVFELIKSGRILQGTGYMVLSCIVGLTLTYLGYYCSNFAFNK